MGEELQWAIVYLFYGILFIGFLYIASLVVGIISKYLNENPTETLSNKMRTPNDIFIMLESVDANDDRRFLIINAATESTSRLYNSRQIDDSTKFELWANINLASSETSKANQNFLNAHESNKTYQFVSKAGKDWQRKYGRN